MMVHEINETDINEEYSLEQRRELILRFLQNNSNQDGIDLSKLYVGRLAYVKDKDGKNIDSDLSNQIAIVYLVEDIENENVYMDLFRERMYRKPGYVVSSALSFCPFRRKGLTIEPRIAIIDLFDLERASFEGVKEFFRQIENLNYYEFSHMFQKQVMSSIDREIQRELKRRGEL